MAWSPPELRRWSIWRHSGTFGRCLILTSGALFVLMVYGLLRVVLSGGLLRSSAEQGVNWRVLRPRESYEERGVGYEYAQALCQELGAAWKVPSRSELARMRPPFTGRGTRPFWIAPEQAGQVPMFLVEYCPESQCRGKVDSWPSPNGQPYAFYRAQVVCFHPQLR